jgi:hypothetical protein
MMGNDNYARRAHRLTSFYPAAWRQRYGDEFEAHLEQEFEEIPHSFSRTLNVVLKGLFTHVKNLTWRLLLIEPGQGKLRNSIVLPVVVALGFAISSALRGSNARLPWPTSILFGMLYALVLFGFLYDARRIRAVGPANRFSKDRNIVAGIMLLNCGTILLHNVIGHTTLVLYTVLLLDVVLFAVRFEWIGRKHRSIPDPSIPGVQGNLKP